MRSVISNKLKVSSITLCLLIILTTNFCVKGEVINPLKNPGFCGIPSCEIDNENEKFRYLPNVAYEYLYESSFKTHFEGTDDNDPESELHISAIVELIFPSKCQGQLKISSAQLKHQNVSVRIESKQPKGDYEYEDDEEELQLELQNNDEIEAEKVLHEKSSEFSRDVEGMKLRFDFRDGLIQEICPENDEQVWVTNFKRGILSALQNTMFRLDLDHKSIETDVSGKCNVNYQFIGSMNTSIVINKTKDISTCQNRNKFKSIIQTTPYEFGKSGISWWPIYNSSSHCQLSIDNYVYSNIECHERHVLIPFSNENHGAISRSYMRMKLISETNMTLNEDIYIEMRKSLLYDHSFSPKPVHNDFKLVRGYLKQMCSLGFPNIQREFPDKFLKFISATKELSDRGLNMLLSRADGICKSGRKHVLESLPYIGSSASIELMKDLLMGKARRNELTPEIRDAWMMSIFYLPRPDLKIIETMFSLIQYYETEPNPMYILIPSSVAHTYCRNNGDCKESAIINNIVKYLEEIVTKNLASDLTEKNTYEKTVVAMKGLGNIGIISKQLENEFKDVIIDESYSDDIKLQVIQAFRKTNCDATRDYFVDIYQNFTQSVEVRIASYLQLMKCPSYLTIKDIKSFLQKERVNQVGSFVWSHLKNMAKTSSPQKIEIQALLVDDTKINDKFQMDFRKFSKNYEQSLFFEEYNFGMSGESNVIFGTESYIPRSFSFNGTINLFGGSINALEFNVRMQGMEKYIESIVGLDGPLNLARLMEHFKYIFETIKNFFNIDEDFLTALLRPRRSTKSEIEGFAYQPKYDFDKPTGYFEHKIFGNDINFYCFNGLDELSNIIKKLLPVEQIKNIFSKNEEVFVDSGTLVDVAYTVPSSTGFPIVLNAFGAYSLDVSYFASINNKNVWENKNLDFSGRLRPSLSIELNSAMQMDLFYGSTETKFKSNVYSNYALETDLKIQDYTHASLKVKLPQDRNDIFSIRTQLISKIEGKESLLYGISNRFTNSSCTWPTIDETLGLKVCVNYTLPDVSDQSKNYPSLILSGPIGFDIHLDKADLSAKNFSFEYNWKSNSEHSEGSILFETPNSKIPRKLSAILFTNPTDYNFTMNTINGEKVQEILGFVKNSPELKSLDFLVVQNGKINLKMEMSLRKEVISKSQHIARPQFLLTIQGQNVAGMKGEIRIIDKNDMRHHIYNLNFETKKLMSIVNGTLTITDKSTRLQSTLLYKFSRQKQETVDLSFELANRSQRLENHISTLTFESSAYPTYNFFSNASLTYSRMGHAELIIDFNNSPDFMDPLHTLSTKINLAKNSDGLKNSETTFSIEVTRPLNKIDLKFYVKYDALYKNGTEHTVSVIVRYSPDKEVLVKTSVFIPKGNLFGFDATFLLTVPDMGTCSAEFKVQERIRKDYLFDLKGKWFGDENIKILGTYQDRTSAIKRFYKVKTVVNSNMFKDVNLMLRYSRDLREMKIDIKTEYNDTNYSFSLESLEPEKLVLIFKTELNWGEKLFSIKSNSTSKDVGRTKVEIHLDRLRDIHIEVWGLTKTFSKYAGIEFKWDANRDPTQKLILSYDFARPRPKLFTGNVIVSYPDRTINGNLTISNEGPYTGKMKISWSADESIDCSYSIGTDFQDYKKLWTLLKIDTPFPGWKNNRINTSIYQHNNLYAFNFAIMWAETQDMEIEFFADYLFSEQEISSNLRASIHSTIKDIPIVFANFKYNQTENELDSEMLFKHKNLIAGDAFRTFSLKSWCKKAFDETHRNISGSIQFISPFENYTSGVLVSKFSLTTQRELYGAVDMDIDNRRYSFAIEGYLRKVLDNMISFNISTPIETFPSLLGKFGIIEHKKYLIADLQTFNKSLGVEILFDFQSITDFDLKFYAATPQPAFEKVLAIGKIKKSIMHIEGGWNKINLGFKRISHYKDINDFEYSYQIFTPLQNFEQNGLILRFIASDFQNFDIEGSFKVGKYKLGIKGFGEPKKQLLNQLGLQRATYIREEINIIDDLDSGESNDEVIIDIDLEKFYSLSGSFEVCTIKWTPIIGVYEIQQIENTYHGDAVINIPKGAITVSNKFITKSNSTDFMNRLKINTPIPEYASINSNFKLKIPLEKGLNARFDVGIKNKIQWKNYGFKLNYALPKSSQSKIHDFSLIILYPLINSSRINVNSRLELARGGRVNQANFSLDGFNTRLQLSGFFNNDNNNMNAGFNVELTSPIINHYMFNTYIQKTTVNQDNKINMGFEMIDDGNENKFDADLIYRLDPGHVIDGYLAIASNIFSIEKFNTSVYISEGKKPKFDIQIRYSDASEIQNNIQFLISREGDKFIGNIETPLIEMSHVSFNGDLIETGQQGVFKAIGKILKNSATYTFEGDVVLQKNLPSQVDLIIDTNEGEIVITYNLLFEEYKRSIKAKVSRNNEFADFESELYVQDLLDWAYNVKIITSHDDLNELMLSTMLSQHSKTKYEASFEMTTPWVDQHIDKINISTIINLSSNNGDANLHYIISKYEGENTCAWKWLKKEYLFKMGINPKNIAKNFNTEISYVSPPKAPTNVSFDININKVWKLSSYAKFISLSSNNSPDFSINYELTLPKPVESFHKIDARYKGTHFPPKLVKKSSNDWLITYSNQAISAKIKSKGNIESPSNANNLINIEWGNASENNIIESDFKIESKDSETYYNWELETPSNKNEKTLVVNARHYIQDIFTIVNADISYPQSSEIIKAAIAFNDTQNAKGSVNTSLPMFNITWFNVNFDFDSQNEETTKFIKAMWPDNFALIDSKSNFKDTTGHKEWKGTIKAEIPLQTKHNIQVIYGLEEKRLITTGDASVEYNGENVLSSHYTCKTEIISINHQKEVIDLSLENKIRPIGIHYTHEKNKNLQDNFDFGLKHLEVFDLSKDNRFNITSEFKVEIKDDEHKYEFIAIHPNRTILWTSNYKTVDVHTHQSSKIELADNIWLAYDFKLNNLTTIDVDGQDLKFQLEYPGRKIKIGGVYELKSDSLDTNINLWWNKKESKPNSSDENNDDSEGEEKSVEGKIQWKDLTDASNDNHQSILLVLKHPKFEKDVTIEGIYFKDKNTIAKLELDIDYTEDPDHHAKFISEIKNLSELVGHKNYTVHVKGDHDASDIHIYLDGSMGMRSNYYRMEAEGNYKRGYLPDMELQLLGFIDVDNKEIKFYRHTPNKDIDIYNIIKPQFPTYSVEAVYIDSPEYDMAGNLILDLKKKTINSDVNLTSDATQKFQIRGLIPDTRSALLNVWRDYDDIRIDDLSYFIQMNHSRLITSKFLWRPKIKKEIKMSSRDFLIARYQAVADELDYWIKTIYTECRDIVYDIWDESSSFTAEFREDLAALKDIDEDLSAFRNFLNESYQNDDFYIQSLMNYTLSVLDELALSNHIQAIPMIFREMWEVLGESSTAFKNSILWIVDKMKLSYKDSIDIFNKIIHGNFMDYVTAFLNNVIENYDRVVKNLHITFMNSIETMWDNLVQTFSVYWNRVLQNIEPQILRSIHYVESTLWSISSEIFDFMYNRTNEFMESPYFMKVSNITHDLDVLYHDIRHNDLFTNFNKYSGLVTKFLKEKIIRVMPFGREFKNIIDDISSAIEEFKNAEFVKDYFERLYEIKMRLEWLINEFQLEKRMSVLFEILKKKLNHITQNALETEDVYRESKTKFIFDPDVGIIEWEQKLPISWHAFNETPQFEEIPEYKFFVDVQEFLFTSKNSSFNFYYGLFMNNPQNLIPPFKSRALLIGSRHIMTFDKSNLDLDTSEFEELTKSSKTLSEQCSYLLAHDFVENRFTIVLKPSLINETNHTFMSKSLLIQTKNNKVEIELGNPLGEIKFDDRLTAILPAKSENLLITRELNVISVTSKQGFMVECNLEFDVCAIEVSGWYFGKIAGILGTMNNENFDDFTTSSNDLTSNVNEFLDSWITTRSCSSVHSEPESNDSEFYEGLYRYCEMFFKQKTSYFTSCFSKVDPLSFYDTCINLGHQPRYQVSEKSTEKAACTAAIAYIEACGAQNIPLRIPDSCVHCKLSNGSYISEGTFVTLINETEQKEQTSVDIVFLLELKSCNADSARKKLISNLISSVSNEFKQQSLNNIRFALVTFGGSEEFAVPRTITSNGRVFTDVKNIQSYFNHLKYDNATNRETDVFSAVTKASELIFKPGAIKVFILSPCSECEVNLLKFDFKSVSQLLRENDMIFHILTNEGFTNKRAYGIDASKAYERKDQNNFKGDEKLRSLTKITRKLEKCAPLAFETEGSIFSTGNRISNEYKFLANVFAKRIARAQVKPCHQCECEGHNTGAAFLTCTSFENDCENDEINENDEDYDE